jgi:hypothetical protein
MLLRLPESNWSLPQRQALSWEIIQEGYAKNNNNLDAVVPFMSKYRQLLMADVGEEGRASREKGQQFLNELLSSPDLSPTAKEEVHQLLKDVK